MKLPGALLVFALGLVACSEAKDPRPILASCTEAAYSTLGVQSERTASVEYLEKRAELVSVCAAKHGLKFGKTIHVDGEPVAWGVYFWNMRKDALRLHGVSDKSPADPKYAADFKRAYEYLDRQIAIAKISPVWWY